MRKTVWDPSTREELLRRIAAVPDNGQPSWGQMTVWQMFHHCVLADEMYQGTTRYSRSWLGRILGPAVLRKMLSGEAPMTRNAKTRADFRVTGSGDVHAERSRWMALIDAYKDVPATDINHWFFGPMTREQVGQFAYMHADHHLRQFKC